ncbi:MAG: 16S rRNA (uracil1498-N3)-methyltransferase, partial [Cyclobacteriaceae bacterium]
TAEPSIDLFIGPEGDFSPRELDQALAKGMTIVSLGDQVLRTETAGLYVCAAAHFAHQTN